MDEGLRFHNQLREDEERATSFSLILSPTRWVNGTIGKDTAYDQQEIPDNHLPTWMRYLDPVSVALEISVVVKDNRRILLILHPDISAKDFESEKVYNKFPTIITTNHPRDYEIGVHWRDDLRRQLNLEKHKLDFDLMELLGAENVTIFSGSICYEC